MYFNIYACSVILQRCKYSPWGFIPCVNEESTLGGEVLLVVVARGVCTTEVGDVSTIYFTQWAGIIPVTSPACTLIHFPSGSPVQFSDDLQRVVDDSPTTNSWSPGFMVSSPAFWPIKLYTIVAGRTLSATKLCPYVSDPVLQCCRSYNSLFECRARHKVREYGQRTADVRRFCTLYTVTSQGRIYNSQNSLIIFTCTPFLAVLLWPQTIKLQWQHLTGVEKLCTLMSCIFRRLCYRYKYSSNISKTVEILLPIQTSKQWLSSRSKSRMKSKLTSKGLILNTKVAPQMWRCRLPNFSVPAHRTRYRQGGHIGSLIFT